MRGQIEDDIDIRLVKTEIQARAVKIERPPKLASLNEITKLVDCSVVLEGVSRHEHDTSGFSRIDQGLRSFWRGRQWLFYKHVLACCDGFMTQRCMAGRRYRNYDGVDVRQGICNVGVCRNTVIDLRQSVIDLAESRVHADDLCYPGCGSQHADVPRSPITYADDTDPQPFRIHPHNLGAWLI